MTTKASNSVLNLVSPPIDNMVLLRGTLDNSTIGATVPAPGFFTQVTDTELASPLVGAPAGRLTQVILGSGLTMTGNVLNVIFPNANVPLTVNSTFYVNASTGIDTSTGGTAIAPWRTLQYAYTTVQSTYNAAGFTITFNCTGAFSAGVFITKSITGAAGVGSVVFSFQSGASVSTSAGACFSVSGSGNLATVGGVNTTFTASGSPNLAAQIGCGVMATSGGQINYVGGVTFNCTCTAFGAVGNGALVGVSGNFTIAAVTLQAMFFAESQAEIVAANGIVANVNGAVFTIAAAVAEVFGYVTQSGTNAISFVGSASGARYLSVLTSIIYTGASGASYYPGNSAGSSDATSIYG